MLIDAGDQCLRSGVQHPEPGVLLPQQLGFFLDLLDVAPQLLHPLLVQNPALLVQNPLVLVQNPALLVAGIPSPVEHR